MTSSDFGHVGQRRAPTSNRASADCRSTARECASAASRSPARSARTAARSCRALPAIVIERGPVSVARPCRYFTLRSCATWPTPPVSLSTTPCLNDRSLSTSTVRLAERDAPRAGVARFVDHLRDVQQRLRRNAAAIEADAAGVLLLVDERHLHAEIGGVEGGRVAARSRAEDRNLRRFASAISRIATASAQEDSRKGCSIASTTQRRKRIASAPSMTRWS